MNKSLRNFAVQLALAAMLLRALAPAGWMPATTPGISLVVCTAQGLQTIHLGSQEPANHAPMRAHDVCPFAAAANLAPPQLADSIVSPTLIASVIAIHDRRADPASAAQFQPHSPRAPPTIA